jgi:hypothetical protein
VIIKAFRKNIGTIIACLGFMLLCIITFGDLGEFMTETYWKNVKDNFASIGFLSVALTLIQVSIKQGLAEQALQSGLNTDNTAKKYYEHKTLITTSAQALSTEVLPNVNYGNAGFMNITSVSDITPLYSN